MPRKTATHCILSAAPASRSLYLDLCNCRPRHLSNALRFGEPGPISENVIMLGPSVSNRAKKEGKKKNKARTHTGSRCRGILSEAGTAERVWLCKRRVVTCEVAEGWAPPLSVQK